MIESRKATSLFDDHVSIDRETIKELLILYPESSWMIKNCKYRDRKLSAKLISREITYSNSKPGYFTAEQLLTSISQMGYILFGMIILDESFHQIDKEQYQSYVKKIKNLECYYVDLNFRFRKKIKKDKKQIIQVEAISLKNSKDYSIAKMKANIDKSFKSEAIFLSSKL